MRHRLWWIGFAAVLGGCSAGVPLQRADAAFVGDGRPVPIAFVPSGSARIFCPTDEGRQLWEFPGSGDARPYPGGLATMPASAAPAAFRLAGTGGIWETFVDGWTRTIQVPPIDPAQATAAQFLQLERDKGGGPAWTAPPVEAASLDLAVLRARFDQGPVLVFEAARWDLVGCFYTWTPWFTVRASLLDPSTGRVLWRETCGDPPAGDRPRPAWPDELEAGGRALYTRILARRALECARSLEGAFRPGGT